jgi:hypothetical protein
MEGSRASAEYGKLGSVKGMGLLQVRELDSAGIDVWNAC